MTNPNYTHISILLDRSGSMTSIANDTIGGFNSFIREQKALDGKATLSLATFASDYTLIHDFVDLQSVPELTSLSYRTNGNTALLYSASNLITSVGQKLAALPEEDRPSRVLNVLITDGEENYSHHFGTEYNLAKIKEMIEHQTNKYSWLFVFIGSSGIDAFSNAKSLGMYASNTMKFAPTSAGVGQMYNSLRRNITSYRSSSLSANEISEGVGFFNLDQTTQTPAVVVPPVVIGTPDKK
jgi:uncharacterized protein YegL